jgi:hypothetical protein
VQSVIGALNRDVTYWTGGRSTDGMAVLAIGRVRAP